MFLKKTIMQLEESLGTTRIFSTSLQDRRWNICGTDPFRILRLVYRLPDVILIYFNASQLSYILVLILKLLIGNLSYSRQYQIKLLLCIWKIPGSVLGPKFGCRDKVSLWFYSIPQENAGSYLNTVCKPLPFAYTYFPIRLS